MPTTSARRERSGRGRLGLVPMEFENAVRRVHHVDLTFAGPPGRVFPLLCPVREYDWIDGWSCVMVYSQTGVAELGCVFRTSSDRGDEVWTVSRYEPGRAIEFVRVVADVWVVKMDIWLTPDGENTTLARVTYTYTALSPKGTALIEAMTPQWQRDDTRHLETMANHYLTTGQLLPRPDRARAHSPSAS